MKTKFYGKGKLGKAKHSDNPKVYSIWHSMLSRCYNKAHVRYGAYGGSGVKVVSRWLTFANFLEDLPLVTGYVEEDFLQGKLQLDKDTKKSKLYSLRNCVFLSNEINNALQPNQMRKFRAICPQQKIYFGYNKAAFCREHSLNPSNVATVLSGRRKTHKGWEFQYIV